MKQVVKDKKIEENEKIDAEKKGRELEAMEKALDDFRKSSAYPYVMKFFKEQEDRIAKEIEEIQNKEMKEVFMLPAIKQREKVAEMSKRDIILTAVLGTLKTIKGKL